MNTHNGLDSDRELLARIGQCLTKLGFTTRLREESGYTRSLDLDVLSTTTELRLTWFPTTTQSWVEPGERWVDTGEDLEIPFISVYCGSPADE